MLHNISLHGLLALFFSWQWFYAPGFDCICKCLPCASTLESSCMEVCHLINFLNICDCLLCFFFHASWAQNSVLLPIPSVATEAPKYIISKTIYVCSLPQIDKHPCLLKKKKAVRCKGGSCPRIIIWSLCETPYYFVLTYIWIWLSPCHSNFPMVSIWLEYEESGPLQQFFWGTNHPIKAIKDRL